MKIDNITSKDNPVLRKLRNASRSSENILIEGPKLINEALLGNFKLDYVAATHETLDKYRSLLNKCFDNGARLISISNRLMSDIGDAISSQGIVAISKPQFAEFQELKLENNSILVVCDGIQDPGNIGAIVRSALAFNATAVVLLPGSANVFNTKAIRGSAGACFRIPIVKNKTSNCIEYIRDNNLSAIALDSNGKNVLSEEKYDRCVIIVGGEGSGINDEMSKAFPARVRINMNPEMESLNASISASLALYELNRSK